MRCLHQPAPIPRTHKELFLETADAGIVSVAHSRANGRWTSRPRYAARSKGRSRARRQQSKVARRSRGLLLRGGGIADAGFLRVDSAPTAWRAPGPSIDTTLKLAAVERQRPPAGVVAAATKRDFPSTACWRSTLSALAAERGRSSGFLILSTDYAKTRLQFGARSALPASAPVAPTSGTVGFASPGPRTRACLCCRPEGP